MKSVIVTGGSAGIGEGIVQKFSDEGYVVFNLDIQAPAQHIPHSVYIPCDVSQPQAIQQAVEQVLKQTATLDAVVSCAGKYLWATIEETTEDDYNNIMDINLKGTFFFLKSVLPILRKQQYGSIVLVASDQSFVGKKRSAVYGATKGAIAQLAKSTSLDYAPFNIRVNAVCPGTIDTPLYQRVMTLIHEKTGTDIADIEASLAEAQPLQRVGLPVDVANLVFFLTSDAAGFITGSLFPIDGGYTAV